MRAALAAAFAFADTRRFCFGGTTEAALRVLRENGFQALLKRAVEAAKARSIELGKMA